MCTSVGSVIVERALDSRTGVRVHALDAPREAHREKGTT
ncbi:MAG: hypothetical protein QOI08_390, partial [Actinomycetota bacterium]|nr:hypothetical protein [Actinomycetota bacterium]